MSPLEPHWKNPEDILNTEERWPSWKVGDGTRHEYAGGWNEKMDVEA